jgi:hypothetical protein
MALQLVNELESIARSSVQLDGGVSGYSQRLVIGRKRMVGDWAVEQVVNLGVGHGDAYEGNRRISLLLRMGFR